MSSEVGTGEDWVGRGRRNPTVPKEVMFSAPDGSESSLFVESGFGTPFFNPGIALDLATVGV